MLSRSRRVPEDFFERLARELGQLVATLTVGFVVGAARLWRVGLGREQVELLDVEGVVFPCEPLVGHAASQSGQTTASASIPART